MMTMVAGMTAVGTMVAVAMTAARRTTAVPRVPRTIPVALIPAPRPAMAPVATILVAIQARNAAMAPVVI
jgi:hypothetical protein